MNTTTKLLAAAALLLGSMAVKATEYTFMVENHTKSKITKIEVSETGQKWGFFDVGAGIPPKGSSKLVWDESTNSSGCEWQVRASYADGSQSAPASFDFCQADLVLEFDE